MSKLALMGGAIAVCVVLAAWYIAGIPQAASPAAVGNAAVAIAVDKPSDSPRLASKQLWPSVVFPAESAVVVRSENARQAVVPPRPSTPPPFFGFAPSPAPASPSGLAPLIPPTDLVPIPFVGAGGGGNGGGGGGGPTPPPTQTPDTTAPVITVPSDISQATASTTATTTAVTFSVTALDEKDGVVAVLCSPASGSEFAVGTTTVECTATDTVGNNATSTFAVGVYMPADTVAPVISGMPDDFSVQATSTVSIYATVTYTLPTAADETDGAVAVSCDPASGSDFVVGTTTVTCSAQDAAGNEASATFAVGVHVPPDVTAPVMAGVPDDFSVQATSTDSTYATTTYVLPTALDDTDGVVAVLCSPASGNEFALGTTTVTCTASDVAGNDAIATFEVGVYVPEPAGPTPGTLVTISSQDDESYLCDTGWRDCFTSGGDSVAFDFSGSGLEDRALVSASVALDPTYADLIPSNPWRITVFCFADAGYTTHCSGWSTGGLPGQDYFVTALATQTSDNTHWTAEFAETSFDTSAHYRIYIEDNGVGWPAYGSESLGEPYWVITGIVE